jgi:hypothetical protein
MKAIITKTITVEFDLNKERKHIKECFKKKKEKPYRDALINVIDTFEKDGLNAAYDEYDKLPYNELDEYPLQESMGRWWWQINSQSFMYEPNVIQQHRLEIIKTEL